jgi:hypothetical protein
VDGLGSGCEPCNPVLPTDLTRPRIDTKPLKWQGRCKEVVFLPNQGVPVGRQHGRINRQASGHARTPGVSRR